MEQLDPDQGRRFKRVAEANGRITTLDLRERDPGYTEPISKLLSCPTTLPPGCADLSTQKPERLPRETRICASTCHM